jgi:hypothetical protein
MIFGRLFDVVSHTKFHMSNDSEDAMYGRADLSTV